MADENIQNPQGYQQQPQGNAPQNYGQQPYEQQYQQPLYGIHNRGRRITFDFEMDNELNNVMHAGPMFDMSYGARPSLAGNTLNAVPVMVNTPKKKSSYKIPLLILALLLIGVGGYLIYDQLVTKQDITTIDNGFGNNGFGNPSDTGNMGEPVQALPTPTNSMQPPMPYEENMNDQFIMPDELSGDFPDTPVEEPADATTQPQARAIKSQYKVQPVVYKPNNTAERGSRQPMTQQNNGEYTYMPVSAPQNQGQGVRSTPPATYYAPANTAPDPTGFSYTPAYQQAPQR